MKKGNAEFQNDVHINGDLTVDGSIPSSTPEGTAVKSTGEVGGTKYLREDGDGTCSWQSVSASASGSDTQVQFNDGGALAGDAGFVYDKDTDSAILGGAFLADSAVITGSISGASASVTGNVSGATSTVSGEATVGSLGVNTSSPSEVFSVGGDVTDKAYFFYDNDDVGDTTDGQHLYVYRRAAEADDYIRMYTDQYRVGKIEGSNYLQFNAGNDITFNPTGSVTFGGAGDNDTAKFIGHITATGTYDSIDLQVNDTTDNFEISQSAAGIQYIDIQVPTIFTGGNVGIGNTSPSEELDVTGDIKVSGTVKGLTRYIYARLIASDTDVATDTTIGGDIECPITGTITEIGAWVDTAGTTGTMTVDVNLSGSTIMTTNKISIETGEKSSRDATTQPTLTTTAVTAGDIFTIDIDAIQSGTAAKGLTVRIGVQE